MKASGRATIPPSGLRPSAVMTISISASLRTGAVIGSTLSDRAAASTTGRKNDPPPGAVSGLNMMATRLTLGAMSVSNSSHLPANEVSKLMKPVGFPPGRAKLATNPGADRVPDRYEYDRDRLCLPLYRSGHGGGACAQSHRSASRLILSRTSASARRCRRPSECRTAHCGHRSSPIAQARASTRKGRPSPLAGSVSSNSIITPIRRTRSGCCARAASGHAAAPPRRVINLRRLMAPLKPRIVPYHIVE